MCSDVSVVGGKVQNYFVDIDTAIQSAVDRVNGAVTSLKDPEERKIVLANLDSGGVGRSIYIDQELKYVASLENHVKTAPFTGPIYRFLKNFRKTSHGINCLGIVELRFRETVEKFIQLKAVEKESELNDPRIIYILRRDARELIDIVFEGFNHQEMDEMRKT